MSWQPTVYISHGLGFCPGILIFSFFPEVQEKNKEKIRKKLEKRKNRKNIKNHQISSKGIKRLNQEHAQQYCQWKHVPF